MKHTTLFLIFAFIVSTGCEDEVQVDRPPAPPTQPKAEKAEEKPAQVAADEQDYVRPEYPESLRRNRRAPRPAIGFEKAAPGSEDSQKEAPIFLGSRRQ